MCSARQEIVLRQGLSQPERDEEADTEGMGEWLGARQCPKEPKIKAILVFTT